MPDSSADSSKKPAPAAAPPATGAARLPIALNGSVEITGEALAALYQRTERGNGGFFPLGDSELFHCGAHIPGQEGEEVYSISDGEIVAARLGDTPGTHPWGDTGFVVLRHPVKVGGAAKTIYSLFVQLKREPLNPDTTEAAWLKRLLIDAMKDEAKKPKWRVIDSLPTWKDDAKGKFSPTNVQNDALLAPGVYDQTDEFILDHKHYVKLSGKWVRGAGGNGDAERIKEMSPWANFDLDTAKKNSKLVANLADGKTAIFDSEKDDKGNHKWKIESGDVVGMVGMYLGGPAVHMSIFSAAAVFPEGTVPDEEFGPFDPVSLNALDLSSKDPGTPEAATALMTALDPKADFLGRVVDKSIIDPTELRVFYRAPTHSWRSRYQSVKGMVDFNTDIDKLTGQDRYKSHTAAQISEFKTDSKEFLFWKDLSSADDFPTDGTAVFVHPITAVRLMTSVAVPVEKDDPDSTGGDDRLHAEEDVVVSVRDTKGPVVGLKVSVIIDGSVASQAPTDAQGELMLKIEDVKGKDIQLQVNQDDITKAGKFVNISNDTGGPVKLQPGVPASAQPFNAKEAVAKPTFRLSMQVAAGKDPVLFSSWDEETFQLVGPTDSQLGTNAKLLADRFVFRRDDGKYEGIEATDSKGKRVYLWSIEKGTANMTAQPDAAVVQAAGKDPGVIATWSAEMAHVNDHPVFAGRLLNVDDGADVAVSFYGMRAIASPEHDELLTTKTVKSIAGGFACDFDPASLAQGTDMLNSARPVFASVKIKDKVVSLRGQTIMLYAAKDPLPKVPPEKPNTQLDASAIVGFFQIARDGKIDKPTTWDGKPATTKKISDIADQHLKDRISADGSWDEFVIGPVTTNQHIALAAQKKMKPLAVLQAQEAATRVAFPQVPAWVFGKVTESNVAFADNGVAMGICALHCKNKLSPFGVASGCTDEIRVKNLSSCKNAHNKACQNVVHSGKGGLKVVGPCAEEPARCGDAKHDKSKCFLLAPVPGDNAEARERWHIALPLRAQDARGSYPYQGLLKVLVLNPITGDAVVCSQEDRGPSSVSPGNIAADAFGIKVDELKGQPRIAGLSYEAAWKLGLNRNAAGDAVVMLAFVASSTALGPVDREIKIQLRKQATKAQLFGLERVPDQVPPPPPRAKQTTEESVSNGASSKMTVPGPAPKPPKPPPPAAETRKLVAVRQKMVDTAKGEIGKVDDRGGDGGKRKGWQQLQLYLEHALNKTSKKEGWDQALQTPGRRAAGLHWSGAFATWCAQQTGAKKALWDLTKQALQGIGAPRYDQSFAPGDILVLKGKLAEHCVLTAIAGDKLETIAGDGPYQTVEKRTRKPAEITMYYRLSNDTWTG